MYNSDSDSIIWESHWKEEANKVADVPTRAAQDAILDHMGPDFRCQNEVMTNKKC